MILIFFLSIWVAFDCIVHSTSHREWWQNDIRVLKYNKENLRNLYWKQNSDKRGPRYFHLDVNINISMRTCAIFGRRLNTLCSLEVTRTEAVQDGCCSTFEASNSIIDWLKASKMSTDDFYHDDLFCDEDEGEIVDWQLPLCFMKKRHKEVIEGSRPLAQTWRMKERVSDRAIV